ASDERLVQAQTVWAIRNSDNYPAERFHAGWRNALLYSEHTWGAHNSISEPDISFVRDQWRVKREFALEADQISRELLGEVGQCANAADGRFQVFNTSSWERTDLVTLTSEQSKAGDRVIDENNVAVPSQRLSTGELVFVAHAVPPFSAREYRVVAGEAVST